MSQDNRTEKASPQRIRKAREDGRFAVSREFVTGIQFVVLASLATAYASEGWSSILEMTSHCLTAAFRSELTPAWVAGFATHSLVPRFLPLIVFGGLLFLSGLSAQLLATNLGISGKRLKVDFNQLNPFRKAKDLFRQNFTSFLTTSLLLPLFAFMLFLLVKSQLSSVLKMPLAPVGFSVLQLGGILSSLLWQAAALLFVWGVIDLFRQRRRYFNQLKMTKQEVREEWRQSEGSPEVRMRIRQLRRDLLRRRMMSDVPTATVVVVNPTHYAVALRYGINESGAPKVIAKGKNYLALRIKQKAIDNRVPVVENQPLAQSLYKNCQVGQEIPPALYRAVAEVLAYVYRLTGTLQR